MAPAPAKTKAKVPSSSAMSLGRIPGRTAPPANIADHAIQFRDINGEVSDIGLVRVVTGADYDERFPK